MRAYEQELCDEVSGVPYEGGPPRLLRGAGGSGSGARIQGCGESPAAEPVEMVRIVATGDERGSGSKSGLSVPWRPPCRVHTPEYYDTGIIHVLVFVQ